MEELRSTEILDKEIQNDARKKAERILEQADADSKKLINDVADRIAEAEKERSEKNSVKLASYEKNLNAALPLEKERFLVSFVQAEINKATDEYLSSLSASEKLKLLSDNLSKYEEIIKDKKLNAYFYGLEEKDVKKVLDKKADVISFSKTEFNKLVIEADCGISEKMGIILEAEDKSLRIRLTISEIISNIQGKYRSELCNALFGGRLGN